MKLHKCKVYKCKIRYSTSKIYHVNEYYKIYIRHNGKLDYFYIRTFIERNGRIPFSLFSKSFIKYNDLVPKSIYINNLNRTECDLTFYKYIELYPNIIKLFESKDAYSIRIGTEILKQQLELNIQ